MAAADWLSGDPDLSGAHQVSDEAATQHSEGLVVEVGRTDPWNPAQTTIQNAARNDNSTQQQTIIYFNIHNFLL